MAAVDPATLRVDDGRVEPGSARDAGGERDGAVPAAIGSYRILDELGRGGMGIVYLGEDPVLGRRIAIKVLAESFAAPDALDRFKREARLLAAMNAPNIAIIHSLEQAERLVFLTMEFIEGDTLSQRLRAGSIPWDESLAILRQIAIALEVAHRNGIVHLDLKPANVKITPEGLVKVLDFGLAMALGRDASAGEEAKTAASRQDLIAGTPGYMSPEQIQGLTLDSTSDVWAFGCIVYECLVGRPAVAGETVMEKLASTLDLVMDVDRLPEDVSPRMRRLVASCLEPDPARRCDSITKARREIEEEIAQRARPRFETPRAVAIPNNLPHQLTRFVGREHEKAEVRALLEKHRLLTLTGVGGGGKTRLALESGRTLLEAGGVPGGIHLVEMSPLTSPGDVAGAVLRTLRVREADGASQTDLLVRHIDESFVLLIFDGCDRVVAGAADLARALLRACPNVRILATSREPLAVEGERILHIGSLSVPAAAASLGDLASNESVELFVSRAQGVQAGFALNGQNADVVGQICRSLEGIPLAIELAAARIRVLPPAEILKRLDDRLRLLGSTQRTGLAHHQTLRAMIDWSYDLLSHEEKILLARLGVFRGGWSMEAAEVVCEGGEIEGWHVLDLLSHLVDKSLIETDLHREAGGDLARYRMLETIRTYAVEKLLASGDLDGAERRHGEHFLHLAADAETMLTGPDQATWLRRLAADHENLMAALDAFLRRSAACDEGWQLAGSLGRYWLMRGHWTEGRRVYTRLIESAGGPADSGACALALNWAGNLARAQGDVEAALAHIQESLRIRRLLHDEQGVAASLLNLGNIERDLGHHDRAFELTNESLAIRTRLGDRVGMAMALNNLGQIESSRGNLAGARDHYQRAVVLRREIGDRAGMAASLNNLSTIEEARGDRERAITIVSDALSILRELGDRLGIAAALTNLGRLAQDDGDPASARAYLEEALTTVRLLGDRRGTALCLNSLGLLALREGNSSQARSRFVEGLSALGATGSELEACTLVRGLGLAIAEEDPAAALRFLSASEAHRTRLERPLRGDDARDLAIALDRLRQRIADREAFDLAWEAGGGLPFEEARRLALATNPTPGKDAPSSHS